MAPNIVLILIDDPDVVGGIHKIERGLGLFEKLIVNIKLHQIAWNEFLSFFGALPVDFDALDTNVFIKQRSGQARHGLGDKFVQTLSGIVLVDSKFPHLAPPDS